MILAIYGKFIKDVHKKVAEEISKKGPIMSENLSLLKTIVALTEDGEGGDASAAGEVAAPAVTATTSASIAPIPARLFNGKVLKRIKRNYFPKKKKSHK